MPMQWESKCVMLFHTLFHPLTHSLSLFSLNDAADESEETFELFRNPGEISSNQSIEKWFEFNKRIFFLLLIHEENFEQQQQQLDNDDDL